jgi:hypothetical protein
MAESVNREAAESQPKLGMSRAKHAKGAKKQKGHVISTEGRKPSEVTRITSG